MYAHQGDKAGVGWDELGDWDWHVYTTDTICRIDGYWEPTLWPGEPYSVLCGDLDGSEVQEWGDMWLIHFAEQWKLTQHGKATILK